MNKKKRSVQKMIFMLLLLAAIIVLFYWYATQNSNRMKERNKDYAASSAQLKALQIDEELNNARNLINTYTYFLEKSLDEPVISIQLLKEMEESSLFDALRFTDMDGNNYASDGRVSDASRRDYYLNGIDGKSGISVIFESMISGETMVGFYAPVRYDGEIIGVIRGVYLAEVYLKDMLDTAYFGEEAETFLCMPDGRIIASSDDEIYDGNLISRLTGSGIIDENTANHAKDIFKNGGEGAFICDSDSKTDNICVMYLPENDYVLVQTFPKSVTQSMIKAENLIGMQLEAMLIVLFVIYIIALVIQSRQQKKLLEQENQEMGYIINGVNTLFSRFIMVDLETDSYRYLLGTKPEHKGIATSGRYQDFLEYMRADLVGESDRLEFSIQFSKASIIEALSGQNDLRFECQVMRDGRLEWEHINVICLERKDGEAGKVLFIRQNITEIKEKELSIQAEISRANRRERQYRIAVTSNAIYTFDFNLTRDLIEEDITCESDGQQISLLEYVRMKAPCKASEWFESQKPFVAQESIEHYCAKVNVAYLQECFERGETEVDVQYWFKIYSGKKICVRQSFIMTRDNDTDDIMVMVVSKEITDNVRKQMEQTQALKEALMQAQHANKAKTVFLSNMSHDIRTPMNAIIGFTTLALDHIGDRKQVEECLQNVLSSSNHLLSLINQILDMSRIESGKTQLEEKACNLSKVMEGLLDIVRQQVKAKQLELVVKTSEIFDEDIITDYRKLGQVLFNLLNNAVKYTPAGGTVIFKVMQKQTFHSGYGDYIFIVQDNGIGMSPEFVKHVFEPFEREMSATKSGIQGAGLGMTITKYIVDMMGGSIHVQSERHKGTTFTLELTLKTQNITKNVSRAYADFHGKRILLAEDIVLNRKIAEVILTKAGFSVEFAPDGMDAVAMVKRSDEYYYDAILMDLQMPHMDGYEATRTIRALPRADVKTMPIIAVTANAFAEDREAALKSGMNAHVAKPLDRDTLLKVLGQYV